ncbi:hypothetical protein ACFC4S_24475 [Priestia megaterium]|uniref:hypothetical protein n=1 Tax=Priestia megaterium TaxID=1404 RepID=UPI0035D72678
MFTKEKYLSDYKSNLEKHSAELTKNIKSITLLKYKEEIELLDFTVFTDLLSLHIVVDGMDRYATQYMFDPDIEKDIFYGNIQLLGETTYFSVSEDEEDTFWEFYEASEEELNKREQIILAEWFADCWSKANGSSIGLPSYVGLHDYENCYDLVNKKWIDSEEKWNEE